jgi:broad specificity phosphatase PhoE
VLVLVKHSLPTVDPAVHAAEWRLGEEGRVRCQALAMRLRDYAPNAIVASTEPKAVETARLVGETLSLDVELDDRLREHDRTGIPWLDGEEFERSVQEAFARPDEVVFGRESIADVQRRFAAAADRPGSAVVAHGTAISAFVGARTGIDPFGLWRRLGLPAIVVLDGSELVDVVENVQ